MLSLSSFKKNSGNGHWFLRLLNKLYWYRISLFADGQIGITIAKKKSYLKLSQNIDIILGM